jgi:hypothetical protein
MFLFPTYENSVSLESIKNNELNEVQLDSLINKIPSAQELILKFDQIKDYEFNYKLNSINFSTNYLDKLIISHLYSK